MLPIIISLLDNDVTLNIAVLLVVVVIVVVVFYWLISVCPVGSFRWECKVVHPLLHFCIRVKIALLYVVYLLDERVYLLLEYLDSLLLGIYIV